MSDASTARMSSSAPRPVGDADGDDASLAVGTDGPALPDGSGVGVAGDGVAAVQATTPATHSASEIALRRRAMVTRRAARCGP